MCDFKGLPNFLELYQFESNGLNEVISAGHFILLDVYSFEELDYEDGLVLVHSLPIFIFLPKYV